MGKNYKKRRCFSRRERHAKTLEIAQEEVLTCLGICVYERLHRIQLRLKEEECTCQVLAAIAVEALNRNFQVFPLFPNSILQLLVSARGMCVVSKIS